MSCHDLYLSSDCSLFIDKLVAKYNSSKKTIKNIVLNYLERNPRVRLLAEDCKLIENKILQKIKSFQQ